MLLCGLLGFKRQSFAIAALGSVQDREGDTRFRRRHGLRPATLRGFKSGKKTGQPTSLDRRRFRHHAVERVDVFGRERRVLRQKWGRRHTFLHGQ